MSGLLNLWRGRLSRRGRDNRTLLVDSDNNTPSISSEVEINSGTGQSPSSKRSVYEPARPGQRFQQLVCSQTRAILIVCGAAVFIIVVALIAALARPSNGSSSSAATANGNVAECSGGTEAPPDEDTTADGLATNGELFPWTDIRLPTHMQPLEYDLFLHPNITTFTFAGQVAMTLKAKEAKDFLVFHMKHLNYTTALITEKEAEKKPLENVKVLEYPKHEQVYIQTKEALVKGKDYVLTINFSGELTDALVGFYKSSYTTKSGEKRWLATTQFEPTDARAAFPCLDEPQLKAHFRLRMVRDSRHTTLFNTERVGSGTYMGGTAASDGDLGGDTEEGGAGTKLLVDTYAQSVLMSTYLVAFVVCDYANITNTTSGGVKVSVFIPEEQVDQAYFALEAATNMLEFYEQFFGVAYPLKKQDLIAIPDFAAGAMENWGLITYRMVALLYDPAESSTSSQQWVAVVVAHELAHQWFGNLVTMQWWNDLWLNEGFASFVEYIGTDHFKPEWKMMDQFIAEALTAALHSDSLSSSHPISVDVKDPAEINEIFDQISYEKGSSIIRMMEGFLGKAQLEAALKQYLNRYQFSNAATLDLWKAMNNQSSEAGLSAGVDVAAVMDTWTMQMGYPVVTVTRDGRTLTATQKRFLLNPRGTQRDEFTSPYGYTWYIPLTYKTSVLPAAPQPMHWMNRDSVSIIMKETPQWIKMNVDFKGFYRVHYDIENWKSLIQQLTTEHTAFTPADRANLLDDAFALASSGDLDIVTALELSEYLTAEDAYVPWSVALSCLKHIGSLIATKPTFHYFSEYLQEVMGPLLEQLVWEDTGTHLEKYLRGAILGTAVQLGHPASVKQAKNMYAQWMQGDKISPNLKSVVYLGGIKYGGTEEWDYAWQQFERTDIPSEKRQLLYALSTTTDALRLIKFLHLSLDDNSIRKGDTVMVIGNIASHSAGTVIAWRFVKQHWNILKERYGEGSFDMTRLVLITRMFSDQYDYNEVSQFFSAHDTGSGRRAVAQSLESIEMNIDWLERNERSMINWLEHRATRNQS